MLDGTLSKLEIAKSNIERSIKAGRPVIVCYVYQDPFRAWEFTQEREKLEGRRITKEVFIEGFFASRKSVEELKKIFGNQIQIWVIKRDFTTNQYFISINVDNLDAELKNSYSKEELTNKL